MSMVIDGSVALAWCLGDESSGQADFVLSLLQSEDLVVPVHWELEVVNGLTVTQRRGKLGPGDVENVTQLLAALPIEAEGAPRGDALRVIRRLCLQHSISAYDAAYLELALRRGLPFVTVDATLASVARSEGIK